MLKNLVFKRAILPIRYIRPCAFHSTASKFAFFTKSEDKETPAGNTTASTPESAEIPPKQEQESKVDTEKDEMIRELKDSYRRSLADMENLRQRTRREVEAASSFAIQKFAKDLLDVADVLEMASASIPEEVRNDEKNTHLRDLYQGVKVTMAELNTIFKRHGVESFDSLDQKFDPNFHNALFQIPTKDKEPGIVVVEQKKGYTLKGRVIRPANVGVSKSD